MRYNELINKYYQVDLAALDACQHCLQESFRQQAKALAELDSFQNNFDNSFVDELCHFAMFVDICKEKEHDISTEHLLYKVIMTRVAVHFPQNCDQSR